MTSDEKKARIERLRHKIRVGTAALLATVGGLVSQAKAGNVHRDDKPKDNIEAIQHANVSDNIQDGTIRYDAFPGNISRVNSNTSEHDQAQYDSIARTNIVLNDGRIVINDYTTLEKDFGIDINDINLQIPDNLLGCSELNQIQRCLRE